MPVGTDNGIGGAAAAACCLARLHLADDDEIVIADPSCESRAWLNAAYPGKRLRLASATDVQAAILERHGDALRDEAVEGLARRLPELSARQVLTPPQAALLLLLGAGLLAGLLLWPLVLLRGMILALSAAFVASGLFRGMLAQVPQADSESSPILRQWLRYEPSRRYGQSAQRLNPR